jgi:membrane protein YqaA with SNARE-associated domain
MLTPLRKFYNWVIDQAEKPYVAWLLFLFAVIEPCVFPTPPDILLVPACIANRDKAYKFAAICLLGSLVGGLIGYGIGAGAMATIGDWLINTYNLQDAWKHFHDSFREWGTLVVVAKASVPFIPVPFFLVTILCGAIHFSMIKFFVALACVRVTRFFLEAWLLRRYGEPIRVFIEKHLNWVVAGLVAILVVWVVFAHKTL